MTQNTLDGFDNVSENRKANSSQYGQKQIKMISRFREYEDKCLLYEEKLINAMLKLEMLLLGEGTYKNTDMLIRGLNHHIHRIELAIEHDKKSQSILDGTFDYLKHPV